MSRRAVYALALAHLAYARQALFWLMPYENVTSVDGYVQIWQQFKQYSRPGYIVAGSAYALQHNGSLGYANTSAGEGMYGQFMEEWGFPALRQLGLPTILGMTYFTHYDGMRIVLANPGPFVSAVVSTVRAQGLQGVELDYEPQGVQQVVQEMGGGRPGGAADPFTSFLSLLSSSLASHGLVLTMDMGGGCASGGSGQEEGGPSPCPAWQALANLTQVNTEDTFGVQSLSDFQAAWASDASVTSGLGAKWAPGFEPGNCGADVYSTVLQWAATQGNVTRMATWAHQEWNTGPQPDWLFTSVNSFLEA